jgi:hypothetical protein
MRKPNHERRAIRRIQELAKGRPEKVFALSPNDVLVQISLPLVLILAIATRLLMASSQQVPSVMDLWKQYLLMRIEAVAGEWEQDAGLQEFPSLDRVQWQGAWPHDRRFAHLCVSAQGLADVAVLSSNLLEKALVYVPAGDDGELALSYKELIEHYPDMALDGERLDFAMDHIQQRCRRWQAHVEDLQWGVVGRCVTALPAGDKHLDRDLALQMAQISDELAARGVTLLPSVRNEYGGGKAGEDSL